MSAWPSIVWDAALLRGLDARARSEIEAAGRMRRFTKGEPLFRAGDPADALFVVASGTCTLSGVRRGDADAAVIRLASPGDVFGEEAAVAAFALRHLDARCASDAVVAEVPLVVLRRALGRSDAGEVLPRTLRALRRDATRDLFRTTSFTRGLPDAEIDLLLDAARHVEVGRGEHVFRAGDPEADVFLVADGLLQVQSEDEGKPRIEAYLARGDLFGEEEGTRSVAVVANGPTWLVAIARSAFVAVAQRNAQGLAAARRIRSENLAPPPPNATAHVFRDLYRLRVARSLLVIDQDSCVRCGHCAWSCADAHDDGVSRLVRRGDKIAVVDAERALPLLVPNSCQHCKNPSCMIDCPTGAIGRDARGEVFIREDLCTGCGSCVKACPWDNIQLAPRSGAFPAVAVKCDLCKGATGGPACVNACPTQSIARVDPNEAFAELRASGPSLAAQALAEHRGVAPSAARMVPESRGTAAHAARAAHRVLPPRTAAWPWVAFGGLVAVAIAGLPVGRWTSGVFAGVIVLSLLAYAATKRLRSRGSRPLYIAHLALGTSAAGAIAMHVGGRVPASAGGALLILLVMTIATGMLGGIAHTFVPRWLSRVERESLLPEELAMRLRELDDRIFAALTGTSELVKTLYRTTLGPYRKTRAGAFALVLSRRTLREEEQRIHRRLAALAGRAPGGVDDLVRRVVEERAVRAQRLLTWTLRGWLLPHLALAAATLALLAVHVYAVTRGVR